MDKNIAFTLLNTIVGALTIVVFSPVFKARNMEDLVEALKTRPVLAKAVASKSSRNYIYSCIYLFISLVAYVVIAIGNDVEIDIDLAISTLVILLAITHARVWQLRTLLRPPESHLVHT
ncbi:hypothetical protein [Glaciimonas sp. PCH181]|uniref:hypothetical protein n=1 Tax=Glaciimonas sp. PCH181 TaxID=2133943 RepID=UPI000D34CA95|nr:hypothetical protein [Glaciimonas sp. PCH181]PUA19502.1 hypothetical protein C7W93_06485 [Glaciimonas sp. PCH181]